MADARAKLQKAEAEMEAIKRKAEEAEEAVKAATICLEKAQEEQKAAADAMKAAREEVTLEASCEEPTGPVQVRTTVVSTPEEADMVLEKLFTLTDRYHAIDTEVRGWTPGTSPYLKGEVFCWSIYCGDDVDFGNGPRLFINNLNEDGSLKGLVEYFKKYLEDPKISKVFQNYSFDRAQFFRHGCRVAGFAGDTMHLARLQNSDAESYSLKELGRRILDEAWVKEDLPRLMREGQATCPSQLHLHEDLNIRASWVDYSTFDTVVTWRVHKELRYMLSRKRLDQGSLVDFYDKFWLPFAEVLVHIEERGICLDQDFLREQMKVAMTHLKEEEEAFLDFVRAAWEERYPGDERLKEGIQKFNPNSNLQMRQFLYGQEIKTVANFSVGGLGLDKVKIGRQLKDSASREAIEKLVLQNPEVEGLKHLVERGAIAKAMSFLSKFSDATIADSDGRVHTSLNLMTRTGRLSSSNPNLQQIPAMDKDCYQVRSSVVPAPGKSFVIADYGQLDLRVLAHTSGCPHLIEALSTGVDLHSHTAAQMYPHLQKAIDDGEISLEDSDERPDRPLLKDVYCSERRAAKTVNFGIAYGIQPQGVSDKLGCSIKEAEEMIFKWYKAYPKVKTWQEQIVQDAERGDLAVRTYRARPRHLEDLGKKPPYRSFEERERQSQKERQTERDQWWRYIQAKRQAINAPVQGGSADLVAEAMVKAENDEELRSLGYVMVLQVHDELIFEGPEEHAEQALSAVKRIMEHPFLDDYQFKVPLVVDAKVAQSWHEAKHA